MRQWLWCLGLWACVPTRAPVNVADAGATDVTAADGGLLDAATTDAAADTGAATDAADATGTPDAAAPADAATADVPTDAAPDATFDDAVDAVVQDAVDGSGAADDSGAVDGSGALDVADTTDVADTQSPPDVVAIVDVPDVADVTADAGAAQPDVAGFPSDVGFAPAPDAKAVPLGTSLLYQKTEAGGYALATWATSTDVVGVDYTCPDPSKYVLQPCKPGVLEDPTPLGALHIFPPTAITYTDAPPSWGNHRPEWGLYGEYQFMPEQRWLHNLEHGAVALLYHPCAPKAVIESLRAFGKAQVPQPGDSQFRQVMSPYPNLKHAIALVTWGHIYYADCVQPQEMEAWLLQHYNKAAEDMAGAGSYFDLWLAPLTP